MREQFQRMKQAVYDFLFTYTLANYCTNISREEV